MSIYPAMPESEKMIKRSKECHTQAVGEFLAWASSPDGGGMILCVLMTDDESGRSAYAPLGISIERLLAQYTEIDMDKVEAERRELLKYLRETEGEGIR